MLNVFPTSCTFIFVVDSAVSTVTVKSYDESSWELRTRVGMLDGTGNFLTHDGK